MNVKELKDTLEIMTFENNCHNRDIEDFNLVFYHNGKAISINRVYIAENSMYNNKVVVMTPE